MKKNTFMKTNDIGIDVKYTVLAIIEGEHKYTIYTNYMPSDTNELGIRLLVGEVIEDNPFTVIDVDNEIKNEILNDFMDRLIEEEEKE